MANYVALVAGKLKEIAGLVTSAGAGDAGKIPALNGSGILDDTIINASVTSAANKIAKLDGSGRLDSSVMPVGIGADTNIVLASEALSAGDHVNIYNNAGTANCRKADAATNKPAHGFVLSAVSNGANATIYSEGTNTQLSSMTPGDQYLSDSTPGRTTATPPTGTGKIVQRLGVAVSATALNFERGEPVELA